MLSPLLVTIWNPVHDLTTRPGRHEECSRAPIVSLHQAKVIELEAKQQSFFAILNHKGQKAASIFLPDSLGIFTQRSQVNFDGSINSVLLIQIVEMRFRGERKREIILLSHLKENCNGRIRNHRKSRRWKTMRRKERNKNSQVIKEKP